MTLGPEILKMLGRTYDPGCMINMKCNGFDVTFKTDESGNPVLLFLGKRYDNGQIKGSRYSRTLKKDGDGKIIKDHWELKGKAS